MSERRGLGAVALSALVLFTGATWSASTEAATTTTAKRELLVWMWTAHVTDEYKAWYDKFAAMFKAENPDVELKFEFVPNTIFNQKDGKIFGIPWSMEAASILTNREYLRAAGLDEQPGAMRTWNDLITYSKLLTQRSGDGRVTRSGYVYGLNAVSFASYLYANGGDFYKRDGTAVAFNSPRGVQAIEHFLQLDQQGVMMPGAAASNIASRTSAMVYWETSAANWGIRPTAPDFIEWLGQTPIPPGPQGSHPSGVGWSNMFVIPKGAKDPALSWRFIQLWLKPEVQLAFFQHFGGTNPSSPRRDFYTSSAFGDAVRRLPYLAAVPDIFTNAKPYPYIRFPEINRQFGALLGQVRNGTMAPQAALEQGERLANAILAERR